MEITRLDDQALMQLIGRAHHGALGELYDRYCRLVYSVAYSATNDPNLAEEITQDTFMRVWQRAESFNPNSGKASSWLAGIARNRAIDLYRRRQVRSDGHADSIDAMPHFEIVDDVQDVEASVEASQDRQRVRGALGQLPEEQRQALALAYFRGLTQSQIAQTLGLPLGTVKTRIRLGMQKLRELL